MKVYVIFLRNGDQYGVYGPIGDDEILDAVASIRDAGYEFRLVPMNDYFDKRPNIDDARWL